MSSPSGLARPLPFLSTVSSDFFPMFGCDGCELELAWGLAPSGLKFLYDGSKVV